PVGPVSRQSAAAPVARRAPAWRAARVVVKPDSQGRVLLTLGAKVLRFRARVALAVGLLVLAKVAAVAVPLVLKTIVDVLSRPEALAALPVALLAGYALVRFSTTLFGELRDLIFARAAQSTVADYPE